jgi:hypothetical protein
MKDQSTAGPGMAKMEQARKLLEQGQHRESLLLALEVLLDELNNLRESLLGIQMLAHVELKSSSAPAPEEPAQSEFYWLPPVKPRILH